MIIYLAHSMDDYNSVYSQRIMDQLVKFYGEDTTIFNPADYTSLCLPEDTSERYFTNLWKVFFPLIDNCEILVAAPEYSKWLRDPTTPFFSTGVVAECDYACRNDILTFRYDIKESMLKSNDCTIDLVNNVIIHHKITPATDGPTPYTIESI